MQKIFYFTQALCLRGVLWALGLLPFPWASDYMGWLARTFGPKLRVTRIAYRNLEMALPELSKGEHTRIILDMWDHLGRVVGEYPHLAKLSKEKLSEYVTVSGLEHMHAAALKGNGGIIVSAHYGNWEISPRMLADLGYPLCVTYREANNPYVNALIDRIRNHYFTEALPKGSKGIRGMIKALKRKDLLGVLMDQKVNTGKAAMLFGMEAMTSTTVAELALKFDCPIIPLRVVRKGRTSKMELIIYPAVEYDRSGNTDADTLRITQNINDVMESWIRSDPEQWFWVHRRWPKEKY